MDFTLIYYQDIVALYQMIKKVTLVAYSDLCSLGHRGEKAQSQTGEMHIIETLLQS